MPSFLSVFLCVLSFWGFLFCSYCAIVLPFPHQKAEVICLLCGWNVSSALQLPYNVLSAVIQSLVSNYPPHHAHWWWDLQLISHWLLVCCVGVFQFLLVGDTVFDYLYEVVSSISLQMQTHFPWQNNLKGSPEPLNHEWLALRVIEPVISWQISHQLAIVFFFAIIQVWMPYFVLQSYSLCIPTFSGDKIILLLLIKY